MSNPMPFPYFSDTWEDYAKKSPFSSKLELGVFSLLKVTLGKTLSTPEARAGCFRFTAARLFPASHNSLSYPLLARTISDDSL